MEMAPTNGRVRFHAVRNDGGVDLTVIVDGRTLAVIRLSASELEDMVRTIDDALTNRPDGEENGPANDEG
jgi:hypothetical protein